MKQNTITKTYLKKNYWQAHSAVDSIFNSVLPEDGTVVPKSVATFEYICIYFSDTETFLN
jgi:hypothetical protein